MGNRDDLPKVRRTFYTVVVKRFFDLVLSAAAIMILSPLFVIITALELVFHGRPVLFSQERPGYRGRVFKLYKFRSMNNKKDRNGRLLPGEERVTGLGRFLRRFSLDELPELFCILKGDMSIIGPRPLLVRYLPLYSKRHRYRHAVKPGLACMSLKPIKTWSWNDQFENDIWYVEHCSFGVDVRMVLAVAKEVIAGEEYRVKDTREEFDGKNLYFDAKENV